jgi:hypothetical protein
MSKRSRDRKAARDAKRGGFTEHRYYMDDLRSSWQPETPPRVEPKWPRLRERVK